MGNIRYRLNKENVKNLAKYLKSDSYNEDNQQECAITKKVCLNCGTQKPIKEFNSKKSSKLLKNCIDCRSANRSLLYDFSKKGCVEADYLYNNYREEYYELAKEFADIYGLDFSTSKSLLKSQVCAPTMKRMRDWRNKKLKNDEVFKLRQNLSSRIITDIKKYTNGEKKSKSTVKILGLNIAEFIKHLGGYEDDMQLDHIIPVSWAKTVKEVEALNHFSNFQWLSSFDNLSKGNKFSRSKNVERVLLLHNDPYTIKDILSRNLEKVI